MGTHLSTNTAHGSWRGDSGCVLVWCDLLLLVVTVATIAGGDTGICTATVTGEGGIDAGITSAGIAVVSGGTWVGVILALFLSSPRLAFASRDVFSRNSLLRDTTRQT